MATKKELIEIAKQDLFPAKALKTIYELSGIKPEAHINILTGHVFTGLNVYELEIDYILKGYEKPEWATFTQFQEDNKKIIKGEKATKITLAVYGKSKKDEDKEELKFFKGYSVFNVAQAQEKEV